MHYVGTNVRPQAETLLLLDSKCSCFILLAGPPELQNLLDSIWVQTPNTPKLVLKEIKTKACCPKSLSFRSSPCTLIVVEPLNFTSKSTDYKVIRDVRTSKLESIYIIKSSLLKHLLPNLKLCDREATITIQDD